MHILVLVLVLVVASAQLAQDVVKVLSYIGEQWAYDRVICGDRGANVVIEVQGQRPFPK